MGADFNYKGSQAYNIYKSMLDNASDAKNAYDKAVEDWKNVQNYLSVTGSNAKIDEIAEFHSGEIQKVVDNIASMMGSVKNVAGSWEDVATEINKAFDTYMKKDGE